MRGGRTVTAIGLSVVVFGAACAPDDTTSTDTTTPPDAVSVGDDGGEETTSARPSLAAGCEPPASLPADPLVQLGTTSPPPPGPIHLLDIVWDEPNGRIYSVGLPGLVVFEHTGGSPSQLARFPPPAADGSKSSKRHFDQLEHLGDGLLAVTSTAKSPDLFFLDASDPDAIAEVASLSIGEASGMALVGALLYVVSHSGSLTTVDVSNPLSPVQVHQTEGLTSAREIVVLGDKAYVADNSDGLVVVDLSVPAAPVVGPSVPTTGGAQDIAIGDGVLFLACGTAGVEIFSLADPDLPVSLGVTGVGGPVISVSASDGRVWTANHEGVQVIDVSDPTSAMVLGGEPTPSWAMAVHAEGTQVYLADWNAVSLLQIDPSTAAPHADPSNDELYFTAGTQAASFTLWNRGAADLELVGMETADARVSADVNLLSIPPGQGAEVLISFQDDGAPLDTTLCLATNDPDAPVQTIALATSSQGSSVVVGEAAPDFILPDLQGTYHRLSDQQGHPVVLCYFATW